MLKLFLYLKDLEDDSSEWEVPKPGQRTRHNFANVSNKSGSSRSRTTTSSRSSSLRFHGLATKAANDDEELVTYRISQLTISAENVLLHHVHLDIGEGVYLGPVVDPDSSSDRVLHQKFLENFRASAQIIHSTFQMALKHRDNLRATYNASGSGAGNVQPKPWTNKTLVAVKEHVSHKIYFKLDQLLNLLYFNRQCCFIGVRKNASHPAEELPENRCLHCPTGSVEGLC